MPQNTFHFHEFTPEDVWQWKIIEEQMDRVLALYDYEEIRLSVLQDYNILHQGLTALMPKGNVRELVSRTLSLKGPHDDISLISLRPEGTISVLHYTAGIFDHRDIHRFYYHGPMFRMGDDGRPREFYQLGVELLGAKSLISESELISLGIKLCESLGLSDVTLNLNNFGCKECRGRFFEALQDYLTAHNSEFCQSCLQHLQLSPFEPAGCDNPQCQEIIHKGPRITDFICEPCQQYFNYLKKIQANLGHRYKVDPYLIKYFSYYNETVFDFVLNDGGEELIIGGGGRYDNLSELITGKQIPAVGFYLNIDIIFDVLKKRGLFSPQNGRFSVYLHAKSPQMELMMMQIIHELHSQGVRTVIGTDAETPEEQIFKARQKECQLMFVIREENIRTGKIQMYNLFKEHQQYIPLSQVTDAVLLARKALNNE